MGRLNEAQRHRAVGMVEGGLSFREVARRMGCSHQTIMKLSVFLSIDTESIKFRSSSQVWWVAKF